MADYKVLEEDGWLIKEKSEKNLKANEKLYLEVELEHEKYKDSKVVIGLVNDKQEESKYKDCKYWAIRVSNDPMKSANVWHLVCVTDINRSLIDNADYDTMKRRFNSFVGIGYNEEVLESGIDRLDTIPEYFSKENIDLYNSNLVSLSNKRDEMYNRWFKLVDKYETGKSIIDESMEVSKEKMKNDFAVIDPVRILWFILSTTFVYLVGSTIGGMSEASADDYMFMFVVLIRDHRGHERIIVLFE